MEKIEFNYNAVAIDTCIFEQQGLRFESGILKQLEQFKSSPVPLLIPDIVHQELKSHLKTKISTSFNELEKALKNVISSTGMSNASIDSLKKRVVANGNASEIASNRLKQFYNATGAKKVYIDENSFKVESLVYRYFHNEPPFEENAKKKNEFPDAIALMSLEDYASKRSKKVLIVSKDRGWIDYAESSKYLDATKELADAISTITPFHTANKIVEEMESDFSIGLQNRVVKALELEFRKFLENYNAQPIFRSAISAEVEDLYASYKKFELLKSERDSFVKIIKLSPNELVLHLKVNLTYDVSATFNFLAYDEIYKIDQVVASVDEQRTASDTIAVLVTFRGNSEEKLADVKKIEVEIIDQHTSVDFGLVDVLHKHF